MYDPARSGGGEYMLIAKHFVFDREYYTCAIGSFDNCILKSPPPHPAAYSFVLHLWFLLVGMNASIAILFNVFIGILILIVIFFIFKLAFNDEKGALFASFIYVFFRSHIAYSGTAEIATFNTFIFSLTILFMILFFQKKNSQSLYLFISSLFLSIITKPENVLIVLLFTIGMVLFKNSYFKQLKLKETISLVVIIGVLIFLSAPHLLYNLNIYPKTFVVEGQQMYSIENFKNNSSSTAKEIIYFPLMALIFVIFSLIKFRSEQNNKIFFISWALTITLFYTFLHQQDIQRYILSAIPAFAILSGIGLSDILRSLNKKKIIIFLAIIITLVLFPTTKLLGVGENIDYSAPTKDISENDWIIVPHWNSVQVVNFESKANVMSVEYLMTPSAKWIIFLFPEKRNETINIYFLETIRCYAAVNNGCEFIKEIFNLELVDSKQNNYNLYLIKSKKYY